MRNSVKYEWTLEQLEGGDIVDSNFSDTLSFNKDELPGNDLGLVRNEGNENAGIENRLWAYVKEGKLPEYFSDARGGQTGYKVPARFHIELDKYLNT